MNAVAEIVKKDPVEDFIGRVLPAERLAELAKSLPAHIKPALFQRNLMNALMANSELLSHRAGLVYREVSKAAGLGLMLDPQLGEAYLIVAYNYKTKSKEPQLRIGYRGLMKLARHAGSVSLIYAHEVYEKDRFICSLGTDKRLIHEPQLFTDRGPVIGYYSVIKFADGAIDFEPMSVAQIHKIRDKTEAWKAFVEGKIKTTPWADGEEEMSKKTVIRRLMKRVPQSAEMAEALRIEDTADYGEDHLRRSIDAPAQRRAPPPPTAIEHKPAIEMDLAQDRQEIVAEQSRRPPPPPARSAAPIVDEKQSNGTLKDKFEIAAGAAATVEELTELWDQIVKPHEAQMPPEQFDDLLRVFRWREAEFEP